MSAYGVARALRLIFGVPAAPLVLFGIVLPVLFGIVLPVVHGLGLDVKAQLPFDVPPLRPEARSEQWLKIFGVLYLSAAFLLFLRPDWTFRPLFGLFARVVSPLRPSTYPVFSKTERSRRRLLREPSGVADVIEALRLRGLILFGFPTISLASLSRELVVLGFTCSLLLPWIVAYIAQESQGGILSPGPFLLLSFLAYAFLYYYAVFFRWLVAFAIGRDRDPSRVSTQVYTALGLAYFGAGLIGELQG